MTGIKDFFRILKTGMMILMLVFCLGACSSDNETINAVDYNGETTEIQEQNRQCWQASLLEIFYNAMSESSMKAYPKVTKSAMPFIMVVFAIWLSFKVLQQVSSVTQVSMGETWTEITRMAFLCVVCGMLASSTDLLLFTLNKLIFPIYYALLEYGSRVLSVASSEISGNHSQGQMIGDTCLIYTHQLGCAAQPLSKASMGHFPSEPSALMQCMVCSVSDRLQIGSKLGWKVSTSGSFTGFIMGFCIKIVFLMLKFAFVLYLVDSIFRMNIVVILLPCLILAFPFKQTRKWTKEGFILILNSAAIIMCLSIIVTLALIAMQNVLIEKEAELKNLIFDGSNDGLGTALLSILLITFLISKCVALSVSMAAALVGGDTDTDFQKKIGKAALWLGSQALKPITAGASSMVSSIIEKNKTLKKARDKIRTVKEAADKIAGWGK